MRDRVSIRDLLYVSENHSRRTQTENVYRVIRKDILKEAQET
jgi:hypothetical protein